MKKMTITKFELLTKRKDWQHTDTFEIVATDTRYELDHDSDDSLVENINFVWGWIYRESKLDGIKITFKNYFQYDCFEPDSFVIGSSDDTEEWTFEGVCVVDDEDGEEIENYNYDIGSHLPADFSELDCSQIHIENVINIDKDTDTDETSDMEIFEVNHDNNPNIRFTGELIAFASSWEHSGNQSVRWAELTLYKTKGNRYVCEEVGRTIMGNERDRSKASVCETTSEVVEFFGHRWLAKDLYKEAEIDTAIEVE